MKSNFNLIRHYLQRIMMAVILLCVTAFAAAQIQVRAPQQVAVGEQFRLQYTINTQDVKNFRAGNIPSDAFEVLMGPSQSSQSSFSIINGQVSQSASITYTYILSALKNGTFTIPGAKANVEGKDVTSSSIKITVSGTVQQRSSAGNRQQQQQQGAQVRPRGSAISGHDLYITATANKKHVYEQEPILLTYKVYTQVELTQLEGKMPDLNGFHSQEIPLPQQKSFHLETVNGKPYRCVTWSQYVMYPQMTGKLEIPSITFKGIVVQENPNVDPFEAFFNGGSGYVEVKKDIKAPAITIQVDPLPSRPANFSGGVGQFTLTATLDKDNVKAGDPVNVRIVVGGTGNLKLVKQPEIQLPKDFEKYDPKVSDKTQLTSNGLSGNMIYDILVVPRNQGNYEIPPLELVYFDTNTKSYKTLKTQPLKLTVDKGDGKSGGVIDYSKSTDNDIINIHEVSTELRQRGEYFFGNLTYIIINALVFAVFIALVVIFRKRAIERANVSGMKGKKANSVASKRLKKAARFMKDGQSSQFYDEVLRAVWGYVADKFAIPVSDLTRDNVSEQLQKRDVEQSVIDSLIESIDECEFERYAPGDAAGNMQKTYDTAVTAITNIENAMKHRKKEKSKKAYTNSYLRMIVLLMASLTMTLASAKDSVSVKTEAQKDSVATKLDKAYDMKTAADVAYQKGNYQEATRLYNEVLKIAVSADVYYNLGNALYRSDNLTEAILAYERANQLAPGDRDIKHNLDFARSKTIDRMLPTDRVFFVEWYDALCYSNTVDGWGYTALGALIAALLLFLVYLFVEHPVVQRLSFYLSMVLIVVFVFGNIFAWQQKNYASSTSGAIVTAPTVTVKKTPNQQSADACVIHEGTRVDITDSGLSGWYEIRLLDGREGWLQSSTVERICRE